ncbi:PIN-like domain-containing protein [Exiguobacterium sp. NPDC077395]|uniref:PIN-like domain-containing protein n=1 Tax=Exiguobacterium sp. NPDC077395 TaxID=3390563 RepID=UPI003D04E83C
MTTQANITNKIISDASVNIAELLDANYVIICDTNVFLGPYRFSPDYANFTINCLEKIQEHIVVPYTVFVEFRKHNRALYVRRNDKIENSVEDIIKLIDVQKEKMKNGVETLVKRQFPEAEGLQNQIEEKYNDLKMIFTQYFEERSVLTLVQDNWSQDIIEHFMNKLVSAGKVMEDFSREEIYRICEEGEKRYKKQIPPGYKDSKNKDGLRKYSDLILWREILNFAQKNQKNIIFVSDDVKPDWWNVENNENEFLPKLIEEFSKSTKRDDLRHEESSENPLKIVPFVSKDFYEAISISMQVEKSDAVEQALQITESDYIDAIEERVFESIIDKLKYSELEYIDESEMTHIGSVGIGEWEIIEREFDTYTMVERSSGQVTYDLIYDVVMESKSHDYHGKDSDTKDVILSLPYKHQVTGSLTVQITRTVDIFTDFEDSDEFDSVMIVDSHFLESSYQDWYDEEGYDVPNAYTTCPDCGRAINSENDAGNGFCSTCGPHH